MLSLRQQSILLLLLVLNVVLTAVVWVAARTWPRLSPVGGVHLEAALLLLLLLAFGKEGVLWMTALLLLLLEDLWVASPTEHLDP